MLKFLGYSLVIGSLVIWLFLAFAAIKHVAAFEIPILMTLTCESGDYTKMKNSFSGSFDEDIILSGVESSGSMMYLFVNKSTVRWSLVRLHVSDVYCIIFHGDGLTPGHSSKVKYNEQSH